MQIKKPFNMFNGILLINKDKICTSHQIVQEVRTILKQQSIGHAGTLDPMARGLMVILCGFATKLSFYFLNKDKRYDLSLKFGLQTDSFDLQGKVIYSQAVSLRKERIRQILKMCTRDLQIPVPIFSAVKVKGQKLYSYAFKGKKIQPPVKKMSFWALKIHKIQKDSASLNISCSKGSYIRSWVNYVGQKIDTKACLTYLNRVASGDFKLENSLTIDQLKQKFYHNFPKNEQHLKQILGNSFIFPHSALNQFPSIELTMQAAKLLKQGRIPLYVRSHTQKQQIEVNKKEKNQIIKAIKRDKLLALLELKPFKKIKILKNFPQQTL